MLDYAQLRRVNLFVQQLCEEIAALERTANNRAARMKVLDWQDRVHGFRYQFERDRDELMPEENRR